MKIEGTGSVSWDEDPQDQRDVDRLIDRLGVSGVLLLIAGSCEDRAKLARKRGSESELTWWDNNAEVQALSETVSDP